MHKFEEYIKRPAAEHSKVQPVPRKPETKGRTIPWSAIKVFVDDFIAMSQDVPRLGHLTRSILHGVESVFPAPDVTGHANGREPLSEKKIRRGKADWTIKKEVLGWLVDGDQRTVQLPPDKASAYIAKLKKLLRKKRIPIARFRKIVGKLRFAALCLPAGRSFMTPLNIALQGEPKHIGNGTKSEVSESIGDWIQLIKELASQPTSMHEFTSADDRRSLGVTHFIQIFLMLFYHFHEVITYEGIHIFRLI